MTQFFKLHYVKNTLYIVKKLNLKLHYVLFGLGIYYLLTIITAFCEGFAMLVLASLFTEGKISENFSSGLFVLPYFLENIFSQNLISSIIILISLYSFAFIIKWIIIFSEGFFSTKMRQRLQEKVFKNYLISEWKELRELRVGDSVAVISSQSANVIRYFLSLTASGFSFFYCFILIFIALRTDLTTTISLSIICLPLILFMKFSVSAQGRLGKKLANIVSLFAADIGDRLNGLFEVKVGNKLNFHYKQGIKIQSEYTKTEVKLSVIYAFINTFNLSIPLVAMSGLLFWLLYNNIDSYEFSFATLAGIGFIGLRLIGQISLFNGVISNIAKFHGNFLTVKKVLDFKQIKDLKSIPEKIKKIETKKLCFGYDKDNILINNFNIKLELGKINLVTGASGSGKSTLSNLVSGLEFPEKGKVVYTGFSNKKYESKKFRPKVGYISQNIYLFHGTLRDNLVCGSKVSDKDIWKILKEVDADIFVKKIGGLDELTAEKGQSVSGGQLRRLGIARVLLADDDIMIFDEPTSGLDKKNKEKLLALIKELRKKRIVILISHEDLNFPNDVVNIIYT